MTLGKFIQSNKTNEFAPSLINLSYFENEELLWFKYSEDNNNKGFMTENQPGL